MARGGQRNKATAKDKTATPMYAIFATTAEQAVQTGFRVAKVIHCERCQVQAGGEPGYAVVTIPMSTYWDEQAPTVALRANGGAYFKIKQRAAIAIYDGTRGFSVMLGSITSIAHDIGADAAVLTIQDDKWLMTKVTCGGRSVYDPETKSYYYAPNEPLVFNLGGHPDCVDTDTGPRFAPMHRFGWRASFAGTEDYTEPVGGAALTRARSWTVGDALEYLRAMHYSGDGDMRPPHPDYGNPHCSQWLLWPQGMGSSMGDAAKRILRNVSCHNMSLLQAVQTIARRGGAFDVHADVGSGTKDWKSTLRIVAMNPANVDGGVTLIVPSAGDALNTAMNTDTFVRGGYVSEDGTNFFDDTAIIGDAPAVEKLLSTDTSGDGASLLEPAWTTADETAFKALVTSGGNSHISFKTACAVYPHVYASYRIKKHADVFSGTKWAKEKSLSPYRKFLPHQLTSYGSAGSTNPRDWQHRDIVVEFKDSGGTWRAGIRLNELELSPDGQIVYIRAMRDSEAPHTWKHTVATNGMYFGATMTRTEIRMNAAVTAEYAIVGLGGRGDGDSEEAQAANDPNSTQARVDSAYSRFSWTSFAEPTDYVEYLRNGSKPAGTQTSNVWADKCNEGDELFTDMITKDAGRLPEHARFRLSDVKRVHNAGQLVISRMTAVVQPGDVISLRGSGIVKVRAICKSVTYDSNAQQTILELSSLDRAEIYDINSDTTGGFAAGAPTNNATQARTVGVNTKAAAEAAILEDEDADAGKFGTASRRNLFR